VKKCLTQCVEPAGDGTVDFIHDDDDDEIDDGSGGLDRGSDVGPRYRVVAHVQGRLDANPVQNDPEDYGKRHKDLKSKEEEEEEEIISSDNLVI